MMAIIAPYFLSDTAIASAAHSMSATDAMVKLNLTPLDDHQARVRKAFVYALSRATPCRRDA
jgi:hypothetical protein